LYLVEKSDLEEEKLADGILNCDGGVKDDGVKECDEGMDSENLFK
jgi:hypothetical protein